MTRKEIREFGQHVVDKVFHKKEQDNTVVFKGWVAKDANGRTYFYSTKPDKGVSEWLGRINLDSNYFPQVNWHDDKPTPCEVMIKIEK